MNHKLIVETIQDGIFIISEGKVKFINDAFANMIGYQVSEVIGQSYLKFIHPDDMPFVKDRHERRLNGENVPTEYEFRMLHKNGSPVYIMMSVAVIELDGKKGSTGTIKNITDRVESELKIKEVENSYKTLLELCPDPIIVCDLDGTILLNNHAAYDVAEPTSSTFQLAETNIMDYMADQDDYDDAVKIFSSNESFKCNVHFKTQKNRIIPFELHSSTIYDAQGVPVCKIIIGRDISQIKEYEKKLKELISEKELMLKEIHHRIKNNLQQIHSLLGLQIETEFLESAMENAECGKSDCIIVRKIINDARRRILAISIVHQMFYKYSKDCIDFAIFVEELAKNIKYTYDSSGKNVAVFIEGDSFELCLDYIIPCGLIINEILINSYKHAFTGRESGNIIIHLDSYDIFREITISDDGIGMSAEDFSNIKTLGLSLIKGLTEQINGTLEVKSDANSGTKYKIVFSDKKFKKKD